MAFQEALRIAGIAYPAIFLVTAIFYFMIKAIGNFSGAKED
ncbi:MAG: hypothetical protein ACOX18_07655 [Bacillota bacterium]